MSAPFPRCFWGVLLGDSPEYRETESHLCRLHHQIMYFLFPAFHGCDVVEVQTTVSFKYELFRSSGIHTHMLISGSAGFLAYTHTNQSKNSQIPVQMSHARILSYTVVTP